MEKFKRLGIYKKGVLLFMIVMVLVFTVVYSMTIKREGFEYKNVILIPTHENGNTIYSGKIKGEQVVADAHIPVKLKSSEIDLCCIIGNLFDNAIEASLKLPEDQRLIRVYMDMKNTQLYISFTNFTAGKKLQKEGKLFRSTKGEGHGFGLVRIDAIIERLEGYISRNSEDGAFTTEILLPQV